MLLMTSNTRSGGVGQGRASFCAPRSGRSALTDDGAEGIRPRTLKGFVLLWFPQRNLKFLYSSHSGVTCHPPAGAEHRILYVGRPRLSMEGSRRKQGRPRRDGLAATLFRSGPSHQ